MITALASLALFAASPAGDETASEEWLELDREIASLAAPAFWSVQEPAVRMKWDAILSYQWSNDPFYLVGGEDLSGVELRRVRGSFSGDVGNYGFKISGELGSGVFAWRDAYVTWRCGDSGTAYFGRFKNPLLWSGWVSGFADPFHDIPITAAENAGRAPGAMYRLAIGRFEGVVAVQNGADGIADDHLIVGRAQWDVLGDTAFGPRHGAYGYDDAMQLSLAVAGSDDGAIDNGTLIAGELGFVTGPFSLRGDIIQYDEDYDAGTGLDLDGTIGSPKADTTPWTATLGYLFSGDQWEILARLEEFDDAADTGRFSAGVIYYTQFGPKLRWALLYQELSSDDLALEGTRLELSLALASG